MRFIHHISIHIFSSLIIGFVFYFSGKNVFVILGAVVGGILIDIDHVIDYILAFGLDIDLNKFFRGEQFLKSNKIYLILHGWELVLITAIPALVFDNPGAGHFCLGFSAALFVHLVSDVFINHMYFISYSYCYRIYKGYNVYELGTSVHIREHDKFKKIYNFN